MAANASIFGVAVAGGGAGTGDTVTSKTNAGIFNSKVTAAGDVSVQASDTTSVDSQVLGISVAGGLLALAAGGSVATVDVKPTVEAKLEKSTIVADDVVVTATVTPSAYAKATGINAGTAAVGASTALTNVAATVLASTETTGLTANTVTVLASLARGTNPTAQAEATGAVGGLIGIDSTVTKATNSSSIKATFGTGTVINVARAVSLAATSATQQRANANSASAGLVATGATVSLAESATETAAEVTAVDTIRAGSFSLTATGTDDNLAAATAGSYGLASGAAAVTTTQTGGSTKATLDTGAKVDLITGRAGSGLFYLNADHTTITNGRITTNSYGALAGSGAASTNTVTHAVTATIGERRTFWPMTSRPAHETPCRSRSCRARTSTAAPAASPAAPGRRAARCSACPRRWTSAVLPSSRRPASPVPTAMSPSRRSTTSTSPTRSS
ncbi:hypothetical protein GCM10025880_54240 [Methylorubrum aminovorans]|uniref:hypothetical protein n=1 Tax=Methylorubrum aminovorans TaxID=269069 RepID=UPI0023E9206C|nr:hypothetical protein [Methylorubrum aminovorans]GMA79007.1 hypothetical protein GCM10025880_54240 [Methylorubrum aminovorans]